MHVACSTWPGGGNVFVFNALAERLRSRGHEVSIQNAWPQPPPLDGDVLLLDHMTAVEGLEAAKATGKPTAAVVHTLWSFVPSLEGTWSPPGYLEVLTSLDKLLVFSAQDLDGTADVPANLRFVGPAIEPEGPDAGWEPPQRSLVVVGLGTTDMGEVPVLQRVLDALAPVPVDVFVTVGEHVDAAALRVPDNARVSGFVRHAALFPHADVFVGHGGLGGIMAALTFGVPVVTIPLDRDQPHNAARVAAIGAGRTVDKDADAAAIRDAVEAVRTGVREREGAIRMANVIAEHRDRAVHEIEALAR